MSELISDTQLRLQTFIAESFPAADISPGSVLNELVVKLASTLQNPIKNDISTLQQTSSIVAALESPEDTYSDIISNIATNYGVARNEGNYAAGKLKVIVSGDSNIYLDKGFTFQQPVLKLNFKVTTNYRITTSPQNSNELLLKQINGSSLYYFILPVQAEGTGSKYRIQDQTGYQLTKFVDAKAYGNFSGGLDQESDKELISRFKSGLSHKTLLSKDSIYYRVHELLPNLRDISLITANDVESTRAKQNVFGISTLGMVDVYAKTSFGLDTSTLSMLGTKTATGVWSISFGQDDAAGFYKVISILPKDSGLLGSLTHTIEYDYSNSGTPSNILNNKYEARFTKYQTAVATVEFDETSLDDRSEEVPVGTQELFDVIVSRQPDIKEIQDLLLSTGERIPCADYLVKATLPCFVTINLKLVRKDSTQDFPVDLLKQDIYNYVNSLKFGEDLHASAIINICHKYDIRNVQLPLKLTGDIFTDHSTIIKISSPDVLTIPTKLTMGVSKKTTSFVLNYFNQDTDPGSNLTDAIGIELI